MVTHTLQPLMATRIPLMVRESTSYCRSTRRPCLKARCVRSRVAPQKHRYQKGRKPLPPSLLLLPWGVAQIQWVSCFISNLSLILKRLYIMWLCVLCWKYMFSKSSKVCLTYPLAQIYGLSFVTLPYAPSLIVGCVLCLSGKNDHLCPSPPNRGGTKTQ